MLVHVHEIVSDRKRPFETTFVCAVCMTAHRQAEGPDAHTSHERWEDVFTLRALQGKACAWCGQVWREEPV